MDEKWGDSCRCHCATGVRRLLRATLREKSTPERVKDEIFGQVLRD